MSNFKRFGNLRTFALAALMVGIGLTFSACADSVSGHVYYDQNENNLYDHGELNASKIKILATRDGKKIAEGYTDEDGTFSFTTKKGYVCVQLDPVQIEQVSEKHFGKGHVIIGDGKAVKYQTSDPGYYFPEDEAGDQTYGDEEYETGDEGETGGEEEESGGQQTSTQAPPKQVGWISSTAYCEEVKRGGIDLTIPLKIDFSAWLDDMPTRLEKTYNDQESFELIIPYPTGCTLKPLYLSEYLYLDGADQFGVVGFDMDLNRVEFGTEAQGSTSPTDADAKTQSLAVSAQGIDKAILKLRVGGIPVGTTAITIRPIALCQGKELTLHPIRLNLVRDIGALVFLNFEGTPALGGTAKLTATVENTSDSVIRDGTLIFTLKPLGVSIKAIGGDCVGGGSGLRCKVKNLEAGQTFEQAGTITMPAELAQDTEFTYTVEFTTEGVDGVIGDTGSFALYAPEEPEEPEDKDDDTGGGDDG